MALSKPPASHFLTASLPAPGANAPDCISLEEGVGLALSDQRIPLIGLNFHFMADFMALRKRLDPQSQIEPLFLSEIFLDDKNFTLLQQDTWYKEVSHTNSQTGEETRSARSLKFAVEGRQFELPTLSHRELLTFEELSDEKEIDAWLAKRANHQSIEDLNNVIAWFYLVRWKMDLPSQECDYSIQLDSVLLRNSTFYDLGTLRVRAKPQTEVSRDSLVADVSQLLRNLNLTEFPILNLAAPSKFCAYIGSLDQSQRALSTHLKKYALPCHSVVSSPQYYDASADLEKKETEED